MSYPGISSLYNGLTPLQPACSMRIYKSPLPLPKVYVLQSVESNHLLINHPNSSELNILPGINSFPFHGPVQNISSLSDLKNNSVITKPVCEPLEPQLHNLHTHRHLSHHNNLFDLPSQQPKGPATPFNEDIKRELKSEPDSEPDVSEINAPFPTGLSATPLIARATINYTSHCISCNCRKSRYWRPAWSSEAGRLCNRCGLRYSRNLIRCGSCSYVPSKTELKVSMRDNMECKSCLGKLVKDTQAKVNKNIYKGP